MKLVPILYALILGSLPTAIQMEAVTPSKAFVPTEETCYRMTLANGVHVYLQENHDQPQYAAFRVVLKTIFCDQLIYAFDGTFESLEPISQFLSYCESKIKRSASADSEIITQCSYSDFYIPLDEERHCPEEIAVIAVGDFSVGELRLMVENYFGSLQLPLQPSRNVLHRNAVDIATDPLVNKVALDISFPSLRHEINSYEDLKEEWKYLILQDLFQERMKNAIKDFNGTWVHSTPRFIFPVPGYALVRDEIAENVLTNLLWQIEIMKMEGFAEEEFKYIKHRMLNHMESLTASDLTDSSILVSFYADQYILGCGEHSFPEFVSASRDSIEEIQYADLNFYIPAFLADASRTIHMIYPSAAQQQLTVVEIEELAKKITSLANLYQNDEPLQLSPPSQPSLPVHLTNAPVEPDLELATNQTLSEDPFYQLPLPEREQRLIYDVIKTMGDKNVIQLLFEKKSLERKGKRINHVHPMRFIGFILSNNKLKHSLREVKTSSFKWDHFIDGFAKRMKEEASRDNLNPYIPGFAQLLGANPEQVQYYINRKDWEGLVKSLL